MANDSENDPYEVLGISSSAADQEVTAAYRKLIKMNHPDNVAMLDPKIRQLAEERSKAINAAHEKISRR